MELSKLSEFANLSSHQQWCGYLISNALNILPGDISRQESEVAEIEHNISNMRTDMTKLNLLLHKEKGTENTLQQDNVLVENMFMGKLKVYWNIL